MERARLRGREEAGAPLLGQPLQDGIERRLEAHVEKPAGVATRVGVRSTLGSLPRVGRGGLLAGGEAGAEAQAAPEGGAARRPGTLDLTLTLTLTPTPTLTLTLTPTLTRTLP